MPRRPIGEEPFASALPKTRCSVELYEAVHKASKQLNISAADVIRASIAITLGVRIEETELIARMLKKAVLRDDNKTPN